MSDAIWGFVGVLIGSIIPWVKDGFSERRNAKKHATYLAARVVCILDKFVDDCIVVAEDDGTVMGQPANSDGTYSPQAKMPETIQYPQDIDWKSIDSQLMYRLLALPNEIDGANRQIDGSAEIASPPDYEEYFEERHIQATRLGLVAMQLAHELREKYALPIKKSGEFDPKAFFLKKEREINSERETRYARSQKLFDELGGGAS